MKMRYLWFAAASLFVVLTAEDITPHITRVPTLNGTPLTGPGNSDCQLYQYSNGVEAINCPVIDFTASGATSYQIPQNAWGQLVVCSGGGTVPIPLPSVPPRGLHSVIEFSTDGKTSCQLSSTIPMQGSTNISGNSLTISPGGTAWAQLSSGGFWNVNSP
jgi:hypothetical protein